MSEKSKVRIFAFGDIHIPHQDEKAVDEALYIKKQIKPQIVICLGDLLDCSGFSDFEEAEEHDLGQDLVVAEEMLRKFGERAERRIFLEGNHEYRLVRTSKRLREVHSVRSMISVEGMARRLDWEYSPYKGMINGSFASVTDRVIACHGWCCNRAAAYTHCTLAGGKTVIFGHTHRPQVCSWKDYFSGQKRGAYGAGCLCKLPTWTSKPVEWGQAVVGGDEDRLNLIII